MLRIAEHFHDSDLGRQRQGNEDNYYVRAPLFVVADGMGGAQAGEVASELAVQAVRGRAARRRATRARRSSELIQAANARIHEQARSDARARRHGDDASPPPTSTATPWSSRTSATRAATCCATAT